MQAGWAVAAGALIGLAIFGGWRDHCLSKRDDLDRVGWVDWRTLQMFALIAAAGCAIIAQHGGLGA
jgi:hypothetical protein